MNQFKNPVTIITVILAILAVLAAFAAWLFPFNAEKRGLEVAITQNVKLTADPGISRSGSLEFIYNGDKVSNLTSTKLRFKNIGNQPIQESDFVQGLEVLYPEDMRIINFTLLQVQPTENFSVFQQDFVKKIGVNQLNFTPILINPGEVFDLDILSTSENIIGQQNIDSPHIDIHLAYKIFGISKVSIIEKIDTNGELRFSARQNLREAGNQVKGFSIIVISLIVLSILGRVYLKFAPKRSIEEKIPVDSTVQRRNENIFLFVSMFLIVLVFLIPLMKTIYNAYFLSV